MEPQTKIEIHGMLKYIGCLVYIIKVDGDLSMGKVLSSHDFQIEYVSSINDSVSHQVYISYFSTKLSRQPRLMNEWKWFLVWKSVYRFVGLFRLLRIRSPTTKNGAYENFIYVNSLENCFGNTQEINLELLMLKFMSCFSIELRPFDVQLDFYIYSTLWKWDVIYWIKIHTFRIAWILSGNDNFVCLSKYRWIHMRMLINDCGFGFFNLLLHWEWNPVFIVSSVFWHGLCHEKSAFHNLYIDHWHRRSSSVCVALCQVNFIFGLCVCGENQ